jgi:hypothetical protein
MRALKVGVGAYFFPPVIRLDGSTWPLYKMLGDYTDEEALESMAGVFSGDDKAAIVQMLADKNARKVSARSQWQSGGGAVWRAAAGPAADAARCGPGCQLRPRPESQRRAAAMWCCRLRCARVLGGGGAGGGWGGWGRCSWPGCCSAV